MQIEDLGKKIKVSFTIKNTGKLTGEEIAQVYVSPKTEKSERALKELKGFVKLKLKSGESKTVSVFLLKSDAFAQYNTKIHDFEISKGEYVILVGKSSSEIVDSKPIIIK